MVFSVKVFMCRLVNLTIAYYEAPWVFFWWLGIWESGWFQKQTISKPISKSSDSSTVSSERQNPLFWSRGATMQTTNGYLDSVGLEDGMNTGCTVAFVRSDVSGMLQVQPEKLSSQIEAGLWCSAIRFEIMCSSVGPQPARQRKRCLRPFTDSNRHFWSKKGPFKSVQIGPNWLERTQKMVFLVQHKPKQAGSSVSRPQPLEDRMDTLTKELGQICLLSQAHLIHLVPVLKLQIGWWACLWQEMYVEQNAQSWSVQGLDSSRALSDRFEVRGSAKIIQLVLGSFIMFYPEKWQWWPMVQWNCLAGDARPHYTFRRTAT